MSLQGRKKDRRQPWWYPDFPFPAQKKKKVQTKKRPRARRWVGGTSNQQARRHKQRTSHVMIRTIFLCPTLRGLYLFFVNSFFFFFRVCFYCKSRHRETQANLSGVGAAESLLTVALSTLDGIFSQRLFLCPFSFSLFFYIFPLCTL